MGGRQAEPGQLQNLIGTLDVRGAQVLAALRLSPASHDPMDFANAASYPLLAHQMIAGRTCCA